MCVPLGIIRHRKCKLAVKASILGWLVSSWILMYFTRVLFVPRLL